MVSQRCINLVHEELCKLQLPFQGIALGKVLVVVNEDIPAHQLNQLKIQLQKMDWTSLNPGMGESLKN